MRRAIRALILSACSALNSGSRNGSSVCGPPPRRRRRRGCCRSAGDRPRSAPRRAPDRPRRRWPGAWRRPASGGCGRRGAVHEEVADVLQRDDVVGDDPGVDLGRLVLAAQEQPVHLDAQDPAGLRRLEDQPHAQGVGDPADDHAEDRKQPPLAEPVVDHRDRDPEAEAEDEAERDHQVELALPEVAEDPHHQRRVPLEVVDDHDLGVEQLVDVLADLVGHRAHDAGSWAWTRCTTAVRARGGRRRATAGGARAA